MSETPVQKEISLTSTGDVTQTFAEVTEVLDVAPGTLRRWIQRFSDFLDNPSTESSGRFGASDVETLTVIRGLLAEGNTYEQITHRLNVLRSANQQIEALAEKRELAPKAATTLPQAVGDMLHTMADTQQSILNSQGALRDLMGVVVQDNFNLKEENRKLRDRILEIERALAEYQRREETRKERLESRLRALEGTLGALQQQVAHWVQLQRERRRGWFW
jgi:DNA-binding transcriptional MerR regulator